MSAVPIVLDNAQVLVNSVDLSTWTRDVAINYGAAMLDRTVMGDTSDEYIAGLLNWSMDLTFMQDFHSSAVDATLFSLVGAAAFAVEVRPTAASRSATNPGFNGNALLETYPILSGKVGVLAETKTKFRGTAALSRSTS